MCRLTTPGPVRARRSRRSAARQHVEPLPVVVRRRSRRGRSRRAPCSCRTAASSGQSAAIEPMSPRISLDLGREPRLGEIVDLDQVGHGVSGVWRNYVTLGFVMNRRRPRMTSDSPPVAPGIRASTAPSCARPRELARRGRLRRASPSPRSPTRAGHDQAGDLPPLAEQGAPRARGGVPDRRAPPRLPDTGSLERRPARDGADVRRPRSPHPAARAALPGLLARVLRRPDAARGPARALPGRRRGARSHERLTAAVRARRGARRTSTRPTLLETIAGAALMALLIRSADRLDETWVEHTADLLTKGIAP